MQPRLGETGIGVAVDLKGATDATRREVVCGGTCETDPVPEGSCRALL